MTKSTLVIGIAPMTKKEPCASPSDAHHLDIPSFKVPTYGRIPHKVCIWFQIYAPLSHTTRSFACTTPDVVILVQLRYPYLRWHQHVRLGSRQALRILTEYSESLLE